jgi:hypothetical protein
LTKRQFKQLYQTFKTGLSKVAIFKKYQNFLKKVIRDDCINNLALKFLLSYLKVSYKIYLYPQFTNKKNSSKEENLIKLPKRKVKKASTKSQQQKNKKKLAKPYVSIFIKFSTDHSFQGEFFVNVFVMRAQEGLKFITVYT